MAERQRKLYKVGLVGLAPATFNFLVCDQKQDNRLITFGQFSDWEVSKDLNNYCDKIVMVE